MEKKLISVLMPVHNAELYLIDAIRSVLDQDYREIEFIIVDDGSTDASLEIIRGFEKEDKRIVFLKKENSGIVDTLNYGFQHVNGDFVARMDADDICMGHRLSTQLRFMDENNLDLCGSAMKLFGSSSRIKKYPTSHDELITNLALYGKTIPHPTVLMKAEVLRSHSYTNRFPYAEDLALWLDIAFGSNYRLGNCPDILLNYRVHGKQTSKEKKQQQVASTISATDYFLREQCGIFTNQELSANYILSKSRKRSSFQDLIDYSSFIGKIRDYLSINKINLSYLNDKYYEVCKKNAFHGFMVKDLFLKSAENPTARQKLELGIKTALKI
ncbi:glycosyltransferase family 2 protein [Kistimonas asteriae]|uniref:glycosyltransferase family 2 protein n=1 Tax=Kistimonas asteriae TaxID=517724 RepID=UPI001BA7A2F5|nr:glycosyltransferase family 2 protein [Kistimonas asteriae]